ncbi:MAG: hypothetical protein QOE33_502 [Acidobacteriota bacterium]|nr:hypothetical protein [Acidobacteriota bacterium]
MRAQHPDKTHYDLEQALERMSNGFVDWRYNYEGIPDGSDFNIGPILPAIRRVILDIKPEWKTLLTP